MNWLTFTVAALAAWRTFHLLAYDDILIPVRDWITRKRARKSLTDWIECPYCLGFWTALAWTGYLAINDSWAFWTALPFAISAIVVAINSALTE